MQTSRTLGRAIAGTLLALALIGGTAACSGDDGGGSSQSAQAATLDAAAFGQRVATADVVVLDVRTPAEFAEGHLPGAVNVDFESGSFAQDVAALDKDATYAVYCRSGNRSGQALTVMQDAGFTDIAHLDGGIGAWQAAGGQVVTD